MTTRFGPEEPTWGLGEVIRAHRIYMGLSKAATAKHIGMAFRSYEQMEAGTRMCPAGFIDTLRKLVVDFDDEVDAFIDAGITAPDVYSGEDDEWDRAVVGRAALADARITPRLVKPTLASSTR